MNIEIFTKQSKDLNDEECLSLINIMLLTAACFAFFFGTGIGSSSVTFFGIVCQWFLSILLALWISFVFPYSVSFVRKFGKASGFVPYAVVFTVFVVIFSVFMTAIYADSEEKNVRTAVEQAYEDAYQEHYKDIFNEGYEKGFDEGQKDGYDVGHWDGKEDGYIKGYAACEEDLHEYEFTQDDLDRLYQAGYEDACKDFGKESPFAD